MAALLPYLAAALIMGGAALVLPALFGGRAERLRMARRVTGLGVGAPRATSMTPIEIALMRPWRSMLFRVLSAEPERGGLYAPRLGRLVLASALGAMVGVVGAGLLSGLPLWLVALVTLGLALMAPRLLAHFERGRVTARFVDKFPDAIDMIVRMLHAGQPVSSAIFTVGKEAPDPVGAIFRDIANEAAIGVPLEAILARRVTEIEPSEFRYFTVAVILQRATGGDLAETLESLASIIRRRRNVRLKAHALLSEVRASAYVLSSLPFVIGALLIFVNPDYLAILFTDPRGHVVLAAIASCLILAALTMRWMINRGLKT
jgi:tight adherence protein B